MVYDFNFDRINHCFGTVNNSMMKSNETVTLEFFLRNSKIQFAIITLSLTAKVNPSCVLTTALFKRKNIKRIQITSNVIKTTTYSNQKSSKINRSDKYWKNTDSLQHLPNLQQYNIELKLVNALLSHNVLENIQKKNKRLLGI
ncbi:hypothetical protein SNEBB_011344 [Seison nebaliae]|nr:hypothetical protein SNEBB_011344 [Seison nebaliae]